jgi:hypothetical protein
MGWVCGGELRSRPHFGQGDDTLKKSDFVDHYETLQVSPNADKETIERVFRYLAKRYHPDNDASGDVERFSLLVEAHDVLSDAQKRAAYDAAYDHVVAMQSQIRQQSTAAADLSGDEGIRHGILSALYIARRRSAEDAGVGAVHLEQVLQCPQYQMDFHIWYLKEKGWVERTDNGMYAITVSGVDEVEKKRLRVEGELLLPGPESGSSGVARSVDRT